MTKIIDRYILKQYLIPLSYCFTAFCLMYVVLDLFNRFAEFLQAGVPLRDVVVYYGYYLFAVNGFVPFMVVVLPIAILLSALYTLTLFARHNELTAMSASGVSTRRLMVPFLWVGLCASIFCAVTQETIGPHATKWIMDYNRRVIHRVSESADIVNDYFYHTGSSHREWQIRHFNKRQPGELDGVKVNQERTDGSLAVQYTADRAEYLDGRWWFYLLQERAYNEAGDPQGPITAPLEAPKEMADFSETPTDFLNELQDTDCLSSLDMIAYLKSRPTLIGLGRARREVDIFARLAMPWSCMVMILLSLPATAGGGRRPAMRSVIFGLGALFGFYFLLNAGILLGKRGDIAPWLAGWLPNLVFLVIGGVLTWRLR